ncbi:KRFJ protein, partial [Caloenas nicobarica]|nr:KRFJ protein [Caloenas nicobarica]
MSCYSPCLPAACGPAALANSCNKLCVIQRTDSSVATQPLLVLVTLLGPILISFPQSTAVGSTTLAAVGSSLSAASMRMASGGSLGLGGFGLSGLGRGLCKPLGQGNLLC